MDNQIIILKNNESEYFYLTQYPDGQYNIDLYRFLLDVKIPVEIRCRIKTFSELEVLLLLVATLDKYDYYIKELRFVYLFGQRSDRAFNKDQCNYWRSVVVPLINHLRCAVDRISIMVPHSRDGMSRCEWVREYFPNAILELTQNKQIVFADTSATYWAENLGFWIDKSDLIQFCKTRNQDVLDVSMNADSLDKIKSNKDPILIFDDLCDGGATFIEEAKFLKEHFPDRRLELMVVHGLFNKGYEELLKYFDKIITTNSYYCNPPSLDDPYYVGTDKVEVVQVI